MKRFERLFSLLLVLCLLCAGLSVRAEDAWSEDYYRAMDMTEQLSDEEQVSLDEDCIELMRTYGVDLVLLAVSDDFLDGDAPEYVAEYIYDSCGFGYGTERDAFVAVYNVDSAAVELFCFGRANRRISPEDLRTVEETAPGYAGEYGVWGVLYSVCSNLKLCLGDAADAPQDRDGPSKTGGDGERGAEGMPSWYPKDPRNFPPYHDASAPRVVDVADLFSDEAEARMEARLAGLREELGKDIVVFTDVSSYGLSHAVYAADFYDFNGYGIGPDYEGVCLLICMEEENRGFWTCCTGPVTRALYTEATANELDDVLYEYMTAGEYTAGVEDWIENIRTLYLKGRPFVPDWFPEEGETAARHHDTSSPRVIDDAGLLTPEEVADLTSQAAAISQKYGIDVAVHVTDDRSGGITRQEYSDMYYRVKGLGYGDGFDGVLLSVFQVPGYYGTCRITAEGAGTEKLSEVNETRLNDKCIEKLEDDLFYEAISGWLKDLEHMEKTGRVLPRMGYWITSGVIGLLLGSIVGGIALGSARKKMAAPAAKVTAEGYLADGSLRVRKVEDRFRGTTTSRRYSPRESKSSGGGGRSSYSGSYSGSSGSSHSGSGRRF